MLQPTIGTTVDLLEAQLPNGSTVLQNGIVCKRALYNPAHTPSALSTLSTKVDHFTYDIRDAAHGVARAIERRRSTSLANCCCGTEQSPRRPCAFSCDGVLAGTTKFSDRADTRYKRFNYLILEGIPIVCMHLVSGRQHDSSIITAHRSLVKLLVPPSKYEVQ